MCRWTTPSRLLRWKCGSRSNHQLRRVLTLVRTYSISEAGKESCQAISCIDEIASVPCPSLQKEESERAHDAAFHCGRCMDVPAWCVCNFNHAAVQAGPMRPANPHPSFPKLIKFPWQKLRGLGDRGTCCRGGHDLSG